VWCLSCTACIPSTMLAAHIAGGVSCLLPAATYNIDVKAKDCSPYTHIMSCSHLCCVTNEHDHGALTLDKVNLSELVCVVQSPKFSSSKGFSCKLSLSSNIGEAISPLTALYMQRWPIGLPVQVVPLSATQSQSLDL